MTRHTDRPTMPPGRRGPGRRVSYLSLEIEGRGLDRGPGLTYCLGMPSRTRNPGINCPQGWVTATAPTKRGGFQVWTAGGESDPQGVVACVHRTEAAAAKCARSACDSRYAFHYRAQVKP